MLNVLFFTVFQINFLWRHFHFFVLFDHFDFLLHWYQANKQIAFGNVFCLSFCSAFCLFAIDFQCLEVLWFGLVCQSFIDRLNIFCFVFQLNNKKNFPKNSSRFGYFFPRKISHKNHCCCQSEEEKQGWIGLAEIKKFKKKQKKFKLAFSIRWIKCWKTWKISFFFVFRHFISHHFSHLSRILFFQPCLFFFAV